jgi:Thiamine pyrophosphate enzyme, N-terminal TPP binding domain
MSEQQNSVSGTALFIRCLENEGVQTIFGIPGEENIDVMDALLDSSIQVVIAGVLTSFFGVERSRAVLDWWSSQGLSFMRVWASVAVAFGLFIVYVVTSPRRTRCSPVLRSPAGSEIT